MRTSNTTDTPVITARIDDPSATPAKVTTVLGTMSIPNPLNAAATREALDYFKAAGFDEVDTATMYQGGLTESTLGERAFSLQVARNGTSSQCTCKTAKEVRNAQ